MSTLWMPRPSNAGTLPCRNNQNCYYLKNGHCWYYHPPQHHAHNQQARTNTNSTSTDSNPFSQQWNSSGNIFNTARSNGRNQSNNRNRGSNRNNRRRRNQRLNQVTDGGPGNSFPTSPLQRRNAPTIQSPQTKRTRENISDTISPSVNQQSDEKEINIEAFQCPISMEVMSDPVVAADGHSYDRICIEQWLRFNNRSPMNNTILQNKKLLPNYTLKKCILEWNCLKSTLSPSN